METSKTANPTRAMHRSSETQSSPRTTLYNNASRSPSLPHVDRHTPPQESFVHEQRHSHSYSRDRRLPCATSQSSPTTISSSPTFNRGLPSPPISDGGTPRSFSSPKISPTNGPRQSITAMPGTMSARERDRSRSPKQSAAGKERSDDAKDLVPSATLGKRVKKGFKDLFKRNPVDENSFEKIEDRHWAD